MQGLYGVIVLMFMILIMPDLVLYYDVTKKLGVDLDFNKFIISVVVIGTERKKLFSKSIDIVSENLPSLQAMFSLTAIDSS